MLFTKLWCCSEWYESVFTYWSHPRKRNIHITSFFNKQRFFSTQPYCYLTLLWLGLLMLLSCCLIYITIIILRRIFYLVYLCPCPGPRSVYVISLWSIFYLQPNFQCHLLYNVIKAVALVLCTFFRVSPLEYLLFLIDNVDEENVERKCWSFIFMSLCFLIKKHLKRKMLLRSQFHISKQKRNFKLASYV